ncbi:MAG: hypothetical protein AVDCRST_MAG75-1129 [uncultured Propionibacteriaceae bacterium]|uniref:Uncharacterized protein n=1 Tax=uncultured Propionibacteriaceae bacterium TaxID=257457 RepID=A0A6J4NB02_9ACTN|nr:MAG: hypothetical protein AVDCRST_MAG75-1129 [uncultured Propionibacteriaceae bacterium]
MTARRLQLPDGDAPTWAWLTEEKPLDLPVLARDICWRYRNEFPDEEERYGAAGDAWCVHDTQYLLHWGAEAVNGYLNMRYQVSWLARVLEARGFPLDRLARNLDIGADVVLSQVSGADGVQLAGVLTDAAAYVRSQGTFLD